MSPTSDNKAETPLFIPLINPCMTFSPIAKNSVDGECIPRTPFIALNMLRPSSIIALTIVEAPLFIPLINPEMIY